MSVPDRKPFRDGHEVRALFWELLNSNDNIPDRVTIECSARDFAAVQEAFCGPGELTEGGGPCGLTLIIKVSVRHPTGTITVPVI